MIKCEGFSSSMIGDVHENFPLHQLGNLQIVFESGVFHMEKCKKNGYQLMDDESIGNKRNQCCYQLGSHDKFQKLIESANDPDKHLTTVNNQYLSYNQLTKRAPICEAE